MASGDTGRSIVEAFLAGNSAAVKDALAEDGVFHSPVADYRGRGEFGPVLDVVGSVVPGGELVSLIEESGQTVAFFTATVEGKPADGVLRVIAEGDAPATEVTLMIRPLETLLGGVKAMGRALAERSDAEGG
jgi:hypothetical protein